MLYLFSREAPCTCDFDYHHDCNFFWFKRECALFLSLSIQIGVVYEIVRCILWLSNLVFVSENRNFVQHEKSWVSFSVHSLWNFTILGIPCHSIYINNRNSCIAQIQNHVFRFVQFMCRHTHTRARARTCRHNHHTLTQLTNSNRHILGNSLIGRSLNSLLHELNSAEKRREKFSTH